MTGRGVRPRRLALPACAAARRLAARAGGSRGRGGWSVLSLRWRRPRAVPGPGDARAAGMAPAAAVWALRLDLHLTTRVEAPAGRRTAPHLVTAAALIARARAAAPRYGPAASASAAAWLGAAPAGARAPAQAGRGGRRFLAVAAAPLRSRPRPAAGGRGLSPTAWRGALGEAAAVAGRGGGVAALVRTRHAAAPAPAMRAAPPRAAPALVWRRGLAGTAGEGGAGPGPGGAGRGGRIWSGAPGAAPAPAGARPTAASRPGPTAAAVDAALLDRLTDSVIGRVERRIRIERERRGL